MLFTPIDTLVDKIIRPPRSTYSLKDLGSLWFEYNKKIYIRTDFKVPYMHKLNPKKQKAGPLKIEASFFSESKKKIENEVCIVYLHGNIGGRPAIISQLEVFLKMNCCAVCFDFIGCGMSEGEYITLGHEEKHQINSVLKHIEKQFKVKNFILYGRSMGAASALLYYQHYRPENVVGMLLDSPYCHMDRLLNDISNNHIKWLPNFILSVLLEKTNEQIIKKTGYSLFDIKLTQINNHIPIYIFYADKDQLVTSDQINLLIQLLQGQKKLLIFQGQKHNTIRQQQHRISALKWLLNSNPKKSQKNPKDQQNP